VAYTCGKRISGNRPIRKALAKLSPSSTMANKRRDRAPNSSYEYIGYMASMYVRMCVAGGSILWLIRKVECFSGECQECQANFMPLAPIG
jgi:hypothetical protein